MSCLHFWASAWLASPRKSQTQGPAVLFLKVGGTGLSSFAYNISNASNVPKQKEVAWKDAIAGCALMFSCHSCSSLVSISRSKPSAACLLQLIPLPSMHSDIHSDPVALSPRPNSSINWPVEILAQTGQLSSLYYKVGSLRLAASRCVSLTPRRWACRGTCVRCWNLGTKENEMLPFLPWPRLTFWTLTSETIVAQLQ